MIKALTESTIAILLWLAMLGVLTITICDQIPNTPKTNVIEYR